MISEFIWDSSGSVSIGLVLYIILKRQLACPEDVAETYWLTHLQPAGAGSNEVEIRPCNEVWTC